MSCDCFSDQQFLSVEQAIFHILENIQTVEDTELVPLDSALDRILATEVISPIQVPPHDNSAMDGYAVNFASLTNNKTVSLVGKSMAGAPFVGECLLGQCVRIMTGAVVPEGCDTVVMQEHCQVEGDTISFLQEIRQGQNIRRAGEDISQNQIILSKGKRLSAIDIALLASVGIESLSVYRKIKVALIATGDELKSPGQSLTAGDIYESNGHFLKHMLAKINADVLDYGIIADDFEQIKQAFHHADQHADVVISSGGVSVGDADYTKMVLDSIGKIGFWKISMKPGKPLAFGLLPNSVFFGLPGNPVSAAVTFYQIAMHGLAKIAGATPIERTRFIAKTQTDLKKAPGRTDFQRGYYNVNQAGEISVVSTGVQGSGVLSSIGRANCFIVLAKDQGSVSAGESVVIEPFDALLGGS
ncbi:molybdopterin molybdotransferase MoeA [Thalassotalea sp. LPB0316]|uniref:molybdopterin molybdotransferase MoeA n=1 Tax=Thalassotalea sp. LPB0316 TaxID=2769490 RepID=UPI0018682FAD|nr:molybdopterin molybdotransferase MoeA [Thalassotalea sp. LPB0316]QOL25733.1 molybdopterin molybdotransferase MoeA [Thalassotalea sp. LPB0316]